MKAKSRVLSTQSRSSFTIRRVDSNDGEAIVACLAAAFVPYSNSYTPAAFTDTYLWRWEKGTWGGPLAGREGGKKGIFKGWAAFPIWRGAGLRSRCSRLPGLRSQSTGATP